MLKMKIFIALIWWLFFGAALCLGVLEHSSDAKEQELTEAGSEGELSVRTSRNYCRRHPLFIEFSKLYGKNNPYIAPSGFDAYYCSGECPFPLSKHMNATTHAVVQKQMSGVDKKFPSPCCVPTTLKPIGVLYEDENNVIQYKVMEEMSVEWCGCR